MPYNPDVDSWSDTYGYAGFPRVALPVANAATYRFGRFSGITSGAPSGGSPTTGGAVDFVGRPEWGMNGALPRVPGHPFRVECGATIANGNNLATMSDGRAKVAGAGEVVIARALQAGSAGNIIWAVFA